MNISTISEIAKATVRRNTEEVQSHGNFAVFDELFSADFVDHTPQPTFGTGREAVRSLYQALRKAFPDLRADIHWQTVEGDRVTTFKTYFGTHRGYFLGIAPTNRPISFEACDVMSVRDGKITDHWGVGNLLSVVIQLGAFTSATE